ncbi:MAG: MFS transporter [Acidimicrobiales bacterium]
MVDHVACVPHAPPVEIAREEPDAGGPTTAPPEFALTSDTGKWILASTILGSMLVMLDGSIVNVALPSIGQHLHADFAGLQWVLTGYLLTLASFILVGGSLGDHLGRRRVFLIGVVWFAAASALCGLAPNIAVLTIGRVVQGIGGALLTPASLAILQTVIRPEDRARAIGAWSGLTGIGAAIGPFLGGWLVQSYSWRWIFLVNVPLATVVVAVTLRWVPQVKGRDAAAQGMSRIASLDPPGVGLCVTALAVATFGLIRQSVPIAVVGAALLGFFLWRELRAPEPMLPLSIFRSRQFTAVNVVTLGLYAALNMLLFVLVLVLQDSLGYSPLEAGAATVPITVLMLLGSARAGALAQRIGPRWPMALGCALVGVGLLLLVRVEPGRSWQGAVLPGVFVIGLGLTLTVAPLTATAMASVAGAHAGVASGVNNAVSRGAGLFAVAVVPLIGGFDPHRALAAATLLRGFHRVMAAAALMSVLCAVASALLIRSDALRAEPPAT